MPPARPPTRPRKPGLFRRLLLLTACGLGLSSCGRAPILLVAVDESYAELRPGLIRELEGLRRPWKRLRHPSIDYRFLRLPPSEGPAQLSSAIASLKGRELRLAASPLLARAVLEGAARNAEAAAEPSVPGLGLPLIGLEWPLPPRDGLAPLTADPVPAYRQLGRVFGAHIAALGAAGASGAQGGLLFAPGPDRPEAARAAFEEAYAEIAGRPPLVIQSSGSPESAESEAAALLETDLRAVLIAAGPATPRAARTVAGPGRAVALAGEDASYLPSAVFRIGPDEAALAESLLQMAESADTNEGRSLPQPAFGVVVLPGAKGFEAAGMSLGERLSTPGRPREKP